MNVSVLSFSPTLFPQHQSTVKLPDLTSSIPQRAKSAQAPHWCLLQMNLMSMGGFSSFLCPFPKGSSCPVDVVAASRMTQNCSGACFQSPGGGCGGPSVGWDVQRPLPSHQGLPGRGARLGCVLLNPRYFRTCCVAWLFCSGLERRQKGIPRSPPSWRKGT